MKNKLIIRWIVAVLLSGFLSMGSDNARADSLKVRYSIVTSDTILSSMARSLMPVERYIVEAILPPGQCPGHYDVRLSDIEKIKNADLVISVRGMPFMEKANFRGNASLEIDNDERNWMAPDAYLFGMNRLADELIIRFPEDRAKILKRKEAIGRLINNEARKLRQQLAGAGLVGRAVLASSMQKEPLEWMGFRVVGEYGRPEAMSTKDIVRLLKIGRDQRVVAVVDNLQSGPDTGRSIARTVGVPHIILSNFPTGQDYPATLKANVNSILAALGHNK